MTKWPLNSTIYWVRATFWWTSLRENEYFVCFLLAMVFFFIHHSENKIHELFIIQKFYEKSISGISFWFQQKVLFTDEILLSVECEQHHYPNHNDIYFRLGTEIKLYWRYNTKQTTPKQLSVKYISTSFVWEHYSKNIYIRVVRFFLVDGHNDDSNFF